MLDRIKQFGKAVVGGVKAVAIAAVGVVVGVTSGAGSAEAALDTVGIQTALDANLSTFETVAVMIVAFVLAVAIAKGIISFLKGSGRG